MKFKVINTKELTKILKGRKRKVVDIGVVEIT